MDGSSPWNTFWKITFPLLRPVFGVLLVLSVIWDFRVFTQLFILSGLANSDSFNLSLYGYSEAFGSLNAKYGLGSAIAMVLTRDRADRHRDLHPHDRPSGGSLR